MNFWNYRIVIDDQGRWGVRQLVWDDDCIVFISKSTAVVRRDDRDALLEDVDRFTQATFDQPLDWWNDGIGDGIADESINYITSHDLVKEKFEWSDGKS